MHHKILDQIQLLKGIALFHHSGGQCNESAIQLLVIVKDLPSCLRQIQLQLPETCIGTAFENQPHFFQFFNLKRYCRQTKPDGICKIAQIAVRIVANIVDQMNLIMPEQMISSIFAVFLAVLILPAVIFRNDFQNSFNYFFFCHATTSLYLLHYI